MPNHRDVLVQFIAKNVPKAGLFVEIRDDKKGLNFIGKIIKPHIYNPYYADRRLVQEALYHTNDSRMLVPSSDDLTIKTGIVRILRTLKNEKTIFGGEVPEPGSEVHEIRSEEIKDILGFTDGGLRIGHLLQFPEVEVHIDSDLFFKEHSLTCGVTRWGKSYTNAVLIEETVKKGKAVLVIDPHGEYGSFQEPNNQQNEIENLPTDLKPTGFKTVIFTPSTFAREGERPLTIAFSELQASEIVELTNISGENQIAIVYEAARRLRGQRYDVERFIEAMRAARDNLRITAAIESVIARLRVLQRDIEIFGQGINPRDIIKGGQISIINLSGLDLRTQSVIVTCLLRRLFYERQYGTIPEFSVFIDEAQRFVPDKRESMSRSIIEELVKEGLKFGISVHLIAQRPTELSNTVRSETGTKIFHKLIEASEIQYVRNVIGELAPELIDMIPTLNKGEAIIVGACTNYIPVPIKIRPRQSKHLGRTGELRRRRRVNITGSEPQPRIDRFFIQN